MADDATLERLKAVVEAYGARPDRWPAADRVRLESALADHRGAPFLAEARALDTLLDAVPAPGLRPALAGRIVAAAAGIEQVDPEKVAMAVPPRWRSRTATLGEAALLAAALVAGLWLGSAGIVEPWVSPLQADVLAGAAVVGPDEANFLAALEPNALAY